ncbi:RNase H domain-containing protein [Trichonephila clavipes]|nr:RNase H domain-containing protein [Trichonephila clavipes]
MVWGCMSSHGVGRLHIVSGTVKAMDYIEILQNTLLPNARYLFGNQSWIFQDDNTPCYRAKEASFLRTSTDKKWQSMASTVKIQRFETVSVKVFEKSSKRYRISTTITALTSTVKPSQLEKIPLDFPEVINSIIVVNIPKPIDISLITCNRHIVNLVERARKRLNILKYISGRDWGVDANTLRTTYTSFIRPILEYWFQNLLRASASNIMLSAAWIITGLRNCCPSEIVLYEANLQPLIMRCTFITSKYYSKLYSYGDQHRTSTYLKNWAKVQRLKRDSSFSRTVKLNLLFSDVEPCLLEPSMNPMKDLPSVFFHEEFLSFSSKKNQHPAHLRQLALETIYNTPPDAVHIFTDGSKFDSGNIGNGVAIKNQNAITKIKRINPNHCSVFRSELIAINAALKHMISIKGTRDIWIFTDSKSSIQY